VRDAGRVIWRGAGSMDINVDAPLQARRGQIEKAIARLLKSAPSAR
jgi:hypothetical protein